MLKSNLNELSKLSRRFKKFVVWGLRNSWDSFAYINDHYYKSLLKLKIPAIWVDDLAESNNLVEKGDLVFAANVAGKNLKLKKGTHYCLHNFDRVFYKGFDKKALLILQVYTNDAERGTVKWDPVTRFDRKDQVLYQPWGTNLMPWEFKNPVFSQKSRFIFWVGSIWDNDQHQGNLEVINELKKSIKRYRLNFIHVRVPDILSIEMMRYSRIAPAVAGNWQAKVNYMPCRMFKNISYGQLGITNVLKFKDLLGDSFIKGETVTDLVENAMGLSGNDYKALVYEQQKAIVNHTYLSKIKNIFRGFDEIS